MILERNHIISRKIMSTKTEKSRKKEKHTTKPTPCKAQRHEKAKIETITLRQPYAGKRGGTDKQQTRTGNDE
jgi:hypothetical protein